MLCIALFSFGKTFAQIKTTKETKIIAVVDEETIKAIEQFENYKDSEKILAQKYPNSKFFMGLLRGKYEVKNGIVIPKSEATITLYTEQRLFNEAPLFKGKKIELGDELFIGKARATVVATKKGELIIKASN